LGGSRLGFRLDYGGQAAASDRNGERAASHLSALLGPVRTITDDYGAEFATHSDSSAYRTIGIYVFLRTVMCSPVRASQIAHALKLPRISVVRRLEEMIKHGYVERVGNAYRVTDKVNIPDLQKKLQRRIDMVAETAKRLAEVGGSAR
jgi:DNA-binding MarR family transcriptional regulator